MLNTPPEYKHAAQCYHCKAVFGLINRKHHCRNCGNTFCGKCSNKTAPIPTYGFTEPVRVCDKCFDDIRATTGFRDVQPRSEKPEPSSPTPSGDSTAPPTAPSSRRKEEAKEEQEEEEAEPQAVPEEGEPAKPAAVKKRVKVCKCGLPMCICPPDPETEEEKAEAAKKKQEQTKKKAEKKTAPAKSSSSSAYPSGGFSGQSVFMGFGQKQTAQYDLKGDLNNQCREAVKKQDIDGVRLLLKGGAKPDYKDRTGLTLLHLAGMFNNTELVKLLIDAGADPYIKNSDGESAIDIAPAALGMKMKQWCPPKTSTATTPTTTITPTPKPAPTTPPAQQPSEEATEAL